MHLDVALEQFLVQLDANGRSPHTIAQYRRHVQAFARWLESEKQSSELAAITPVVIAAFFTSSAARCRAGDATLTKRPTSVNALRTSLRCFFAHLHDAGLVAANPARLLKRARCGPPPPRSLTRDEQDKLMSALASATDPVGRRDYALFHLLLATGLRVSSALALRAEDVDLEAGELRVLSTKGAHPTRAFLGRAIRDHLREFVDARSHGLLFEGRARGAFDRRHAHRRLRHWLVAAGIKRPASPHALRHSFAMDLYARTKDIAVVKEALAHRSIASTLVYAQASPSRLRCVLAAW